MCEAKWPPITCTLDEFLTTLQARQIPRFPPVSTSRRGRGFVFSHDREQDLAPWRTRHRIQDMGMYALVDRVWTTPFAAWIGRRRVLEIMAGAGWLAKAMLEHGSAWLATDDYSWGAHRTNGGEPWTRVAPVLQMNASETVQTFGYDSDVLVCSWPYMNDDFAEACALWGPEKPIVYIGEGEGGCTASDRFFAHFCEAPDVPAFSLMAWSGVHDYVQVGYWSVELLSNDTTGEESSR